jgi:coenzyme F420-reducing hydrogenase gamma subunit
MSARPRLAVFKFASCDGCQLSLLDAEDELLQVARLVEIAYFPEASSRMLDGPYDVSLVEGSITTPHDATRIREVRRQSRFLMTIGACATAGGIQALRNWADSAEFVQAVYARPEYIQTLATSTAIADHVPVDFELRGCPINKRQLVEVVAALAAGRRPRTPSHGVCLDCKRRGTVCVMVAHGTPCLGPVTQAGCGAICPAYDRGCYACFGPAPQANLVSLTDEFRRGGMSEREAARYLKSFNGYAPEFRRESDRLFAVASAGDSAARSTGVPSPEPPA